jgi:RNA polymerase primary sigma factor
MMLQQTLRGPRPGPAWRGRSGAIVVRPVPSGEPAKGQSNRSCRQAGPVAELATQNVWCGSNTQRARRGQNRKHEYVYNPIFDAPDAPRTILVPTPAAMNDPRPKVTRPADLPPYFASLCGEAPLLSREQEVHLFRKLNYLKYRAAKLSEAPSPVRPGATDCEEVARFEAEAQAVRNQIVRANLRLVVSIAKKQISASENCFELISDGNVSLIRAVEKFDYARGFRFSTYASRAIMKNYARSLSKDRTRRDRFVTGHEEQFQVAADHRTGEHESECVLQQMQEVLKGMLSRLERREHRIIVNRYGLNGDNKLTLEQLGEELGITKERVRQIESKAMEKLRKLAVEQHIDRPAS